MATSILAEPISEENLIVEGNYRQQQTRYGFWLERSPQSVINSAPPPVLLDDAVNYTNDKDLVFLDMAQDFTLAEPSAQIITPTQGGGKLVEDYGSIIKEGTISGTTGYLPFKATPNRLLGQVGSAPLPLVTDDEANLKSGYAQFVLLRNLFRRYQHIMRYGSREERESTLMHFLDTKLDDYWIIQPTSFQLRRSSRSPMTFSYNIQFRTLSTSLVSHVTKTLTLPEDREWSPELLQKMAPVRTPPELLGDFSRGDLTTPFAQRLLEIASDIRTVTNEFTGFARKLVNDLLFNLDAFVVLLSSPIFAVRDIYALPAALLARLANSLDGILELGDLIADTITFDRFINEQYIEARGIIEAISSRSATIWGDLDVGQINRENQKWVERRATELGVMGSLPVQPFVTEAGFKSVYTRPPGRETGLRAAIVRQGDNIFAIALRELGDTQRFIDLIVLNGLVAPFIINEPGAQKKPGVLYPGNTIFVPAPNPGLVNAVEVEFEDTNVRNRFEGVLTGSDLMTSTFEDSTQAWIPGQWVGYTFKINSEFHIVVESTTTTVRTNHPFTSTVPLPGSAYVLELVQFHYQKQPTAVELTYGRDILVDFKFGSQMEKGAFGILGPGGDVVTITGIPNYIQALRLLLATEQGRNYFHIYYGVPFFLGRAPSVPKLALYKLGLRRAIVTDPRTDDIVRLNVSKRLDVLNTTLEVRPIGVAKNLIVQVTR